MFVRARRYDRRPYRLRADTASSPPATRRLLRALQIPHTIPGRTDQINRRQATGSLAGSPPACDADLYQARNTVARGCARRKHWRGNATHDDQHARIDLATSVRNHRIRRADTPYARGRRRPRAAPTCRWRPLLPARSACCRRRVARARGGAGSRRRPTGRPRGRPGGRPCARRGGAGRRARRPDALRAYSNLVATEGADLATLYGWLAELATTGRWWSGSRRRPARRGPWCRCGWRCRARACSSSGWRPRPSCGTRASA